MAKGAESQACGYHPCSREYRQNRLMSNLTGIGRDRLRKEAVPYERRPNQEPTMIGLDLAESVSPS